VKGSISLSVFPNSLFSKRSKQKIILGNILENYHFDCTPSRNFIIMKNLLQNVEVIYHLMIHVNVRSYQDSYVWKNFPEPFSRHIDGSGNFSRKIRILSSVWRNCAGVTLIATYIFSNSLSTLYRNTRLTLQNVTAGNGSSDVLFANERTHVIVGSS